MAALIQFCPIMKCAKHGDVASPTHPLRGPELRASQVWKREQPETAS
jgi:hypothetical protein